MKIMVEELENELSDYPLGSQDGLGFQSKVVAKLTNTFGIGTWLITEGEKDCDGIWTLFGYCQLKDWEWGHIILDDLETIFSNLGANFDRVIYKEKPLLKDLI
jgi:hypothetical protein